MNQQELLRVIAKHECHDEIWWNEELQFYVNCNDVFGWACADAEDISTDEDIALLDRSLTESKTHGALLYCARRRKERPQGALYKHLPPEVQELLNACGPERPIDFFNPQDQQGNYCYKDETTKKETNE